MDEIATSFPSIFLLSAWQEDALLILARMGIWGGAMQIQRRQQS